MFTAATKDGTRILDTYKCDYTSFHHVDHQNKRKLHKYIVGVISYNSWMKMFDTTFCLKCNWKDFSFRQLYL